MGTFFGGNCARRVGVGFARAEDESAGALLTQFTFKQFDMAVVREWRVVTVAVEEMDLISSAAGAKNPFVGGVVSFTLPVQPIALKVVLYWVSAACFSRVTKRMTTLCPPGVTTPRLIACQSL